MISKVHILDSANQSLPFKIWMMYKIINVEIQVHSDFGAAAKIRIAKYKIPPINVAEALCMGTAKNGIIFVFWWGVGGSCDSVGWFLCRALS